MTEAATLLALADRVEKLTAPCRETDAEIWLAVTPGATRQKSVVKSSKGLWPDYEIDETRNASHALIIVPKYSASLDVAMTLVPEGIAWMVGCASGGGFFAALGTTDEAIASGAPDIDVDDVIAATPACALTAASLRARAAANG